nr:Retrovirus-related Pol polyprotein from transposon TNT 1-94 [Ipomoea batatas]
MPWMLMGDFNDVICLEEKISGAPQPQWLIRGFREAIDFSGLRDYHFMGQHAGDDFQSWLRTALDVFSKEQFCTLSIVCWDIWNLRNNLIWNNHAIELVDNLIFKSKSYYAAWITATKDDNHNKVPVSPNSKWEKPQHGLVKLNVDTAINEIGGCMGTGCVLRNDGGMYMAARGANMRGTFSPKEAEALAIHDSLCWLKSHTQGKVIVESDSLQVSTTSANLTAHRLMGYVNGSISPPPATLPVVTEGTTATPTVTIPNPDFEVWSIIDAQLCACLLAIISSSVKNNLHGLTSAATIWSHLQLWYNSLSRIHIFMLKEQLHNIQKGGDSMQKYLDSIVKIVAALDHAKSAIPEQDVILCVLRGLPSEYSSIKQNIRTNIVTVTFAQVSSWLLTKLKNLFCKWNREFSFVSRPRAPNHTRLFMSDVVVDGVRIMAEHGIAGIVFCSEYSGSSISTPQAFYASQSANSNENWFLDAGANAHVTPDLSRLYSHTPYSSTETVTSAGGHPLPIAHVGSGKIPTASGIFHLGNLLHVLSLKSHLLYVYRFTKDNNCTLVFNPSEFQILDNKTHLVRYRGPCEHGLYMLPSSYQVTPELSPSLRSTVVTSQDWHRRLGHPSLQLTNSLLSSLGSSLSDVSTDSPTPSSPSSSYFGVLPLFPHFPIISSGPAHMPLDTQAFGYPPTTITSNLLETLPEPQFVHSPPPGSPSPETQFANPTHLPDASPIQPASPPPSPELSANPIPYTERPQQSSRNTDFESEEEDAPSTASSDCEIQPMHFNFEQIYQIHDDQPQRRGKKPMRDADISYYHTGATFALNR